MKRPGYKKLSEAVSQLHTFHDRYHPSEEIDKATIDKPINPFKQYSVLSQELKVLKKQVFKNRKRETTNLAKNKPLLKLSCFELMEHNFRENTHSNILQYLFDYRVNGTIGTEILAQFVEQVQPKEAKGLSRLVRRGQYTVDREISAEGGRMDVLIRDDKNRFVIVIENKVYANIGQHGEIDDDSEPDTQLNVYYRYVERNYKSYKRRYILLSYKPIKKKHPLFISSDYSILYSILKNIHTDNIIVSQYKLLLHSLVHKITNKYAILEQLSLLKADKEIDLNTLEIINGVLYERK